MNESDSDLKNLKNRFIYWGLAWDANGLGKSIDGRCRRSSQPENSTSERSCILIQLSEAPIFISSCSGISMIWACPMLF